MLTIQSKPNSLVYSGSTTIKFQFYPYPYYVANYYEQAGCVAIYDANYNAGFGSHANGFDLQ
jgi:hypothetical protein